MLSEFAMVVFCLSGSLLAQDAEPKTDLFMYDLHKFKSFWAGSGAGIQYPGRMLLTSDKLRNQYGALVSMDKFDIGTTFSTELTFDYHITDPEFTNQNFIFALTQNKNPIEKFSPDTDSYLPLPNQFEGFVLYFRNFETAHTGWFSSGNVSKEEILSRGKVCKLSARKQNQLRVLIKYQNKIMNVYFEDPKDASLRLCGQFTDVQIERAQYLMASASDDAGFSQISISKWTFSTDTKLEIVPEEQKRLGDSVYAYWSTDAGANPTADISNFKATALYFYDNSKVYSEELFKLADKNMSDLKNEFEGELSVTAERLKGAIEIIGKEADQLEGLGWVLTHIKNQHKYNTIEVLNMAVNWLDSIEDSIDKTDAETRVIYDLISKLNLESAVEEILFKAENLISNLKKLNFKALYLSKEESLSFLEDESKLEDWKDSLRQFQKVVKDKIKQNQAKGSSSAASYGMSIAWLAGVLVLVGFVWIYCKLKSAVDKSSSASF